MLFRSQQDRIQQKYIETTNRIEKFGEDTENGNVNVLNKKKDEYFEHLQRIQEIKIKYDNNYKNTSLIEAQQDLNYLEHLS